ncbi:MAG TPA: UDP-N-acetylmuramoyl-L-alanine--D-glutamate ligase [Lachnospiraceae bacterium]|nr:UDP-N-acetylmuramoyl-L-alanine--D-glutamate ligase [Lachnospiraceae bacterium]
MRQKLYQKTVLVVGTGISGIGATKLLLEAEALPILYDANKALDIVAVQEKLKTKQEVPVYAGELPKEIEEQIDLLVISPGVPRDNDFVQSFTKRGITIWGEVELAYVFDLGNVLAITGTNGKTTTTALTGAIMQRVCQDTFIVGNIGNPYTSAVLQSNQNSVTVAEISSFQLETIEQFRPKVSAILNITPDHLDRHHSLENYIKEKEKISQNQTEEDTIVLNYEDAVTRAIGTRARAKVVYFSSRTKLKDGIYLSEDVIYKAVNGEAERLINVHETQLLGIHSFENIMAAIAMTDAYGVPMEDILSAVKVFKAVEHRIEFVANKSGVDYYNDSKGTNVDAAIKGIQAMVRPTYLIGGGYDKGATYDEWIEAFDGKVKELILLGATRDMIAACAKAHGFQNIKYVESLEEAVSYCAEKAQDGDAVLLSPACASWGMFKNYEERGRIFKELVNQL